jgi:hypothetical protein
MMSMPGVRAQEVSSAPSESQAGECVQPARAHAHGIAEPAAMSLSEAVTAVRAERDMLLVRRHVGRQRERAGALHENTLMKPAHRLRWTPSGRHMPTQLHSATPLCSVSKTWTSKRSWCV